MDRRNFLKASATVGGVTLVGNTFSFGNSGHAPVTEAPWFDRSMRWAQLAFVENDPGHYDPEFWLEIRDHAEAQLAEHAAYREVRKIAQA